MSSENARTLARWYDAFNSADFEAAILQVSSDVVLAPGVVAPDQEARYLGPAGVIDFLRSVAEAWHSVTAVPLEQLAAGDRILSVDRWTFSGSQEMTIERELPTVYSFRGGLISKIDGFTERAHARAAIGLSD